MHESGDNSSGRKEGKDQNMKRILIFSGTTEGRRITEFLDGRNVKFMSVPQPNMEKNVPESMRIRKSFLGVWIRSRWQR